MGVLGSHFVGWGGCAGDPLPVPQPLMSNVGLEKAVEAAMDEKNLKIEYF